MKTIKTALLTITILTLTGCGLIETKQAHTTILVETVKDICGAGRVMIESSVKRIGDNDNSSFKVECTMSKSVEVEL